MISVISPAKTLDYESKVPFKDYSISEHLSDSKSLMKGLKLLEAEDLSSLMGLSDKLASLNFERNMNWNAEKKPSKDTRQAIYAFKGDVYMGLNAGNLTEQQIKFLDTHLRILSGLYGILRPLDLMEPYRLEMGTKFNNTKGKNLYEFWGKKIALSLASALESHKIRAVLNLASVEYFSSIKLSELNVPVFSPVFKDYKNGKYKIISFYAKKARGLMARYIVLNKIDKPEEILGFNLEGYSHSKKDSSQFSPVFLRKQK